jgi:hypothetical protein
VWLRSLSTTYRGSKSPSTPPQLARSWIYLRSGGLLRRGMTFPFLSYILFATNIFAPENKCLSKKDKAHVRLDIPWNSVQWFVSLLSKAWVPEISIPNLNQCTGMRLSVSARSTNGTSVSCKGERSYLIIRDPDDPCKIILPMSFVLWFNNSNSLHANVSAYTSELQRLFACPSCTMFSRWKSSIYDAFRTLWTTLKTPNGYHFRQIFWGFSKKIKRLALLIS